MPRRRFITLRSILTLRRWWWVITTYRWVGTWRRRLGSFTAFGTIRFHRLLIPVGPGWSFSRFGLLAWVRPNRALGGRFISGGTSPKGAGGCRPPRHGFSGARLAVSYGRPPLR